MGRRRNDAPSLNNKASQDIFSSSAAICLPEGEFIHHDEFPKKSPKVVLSLVEEKHYFQKNPKDNSWKKKIFRRTPPPYLRFTGVST